MRIFDRRHRWGDPVWDGPVIQRTCVACGRVDRAETIIPQSFVESLLVYIGRPNIYAHNLRAS